VEKTDIINVSYIHAMISILSFLTYLAGKDREIPDFLVCAQGCKISDTHILLARFKVNKCAIRGKH